mgnify:CR=1 FL=1
MNTIDAGIMIRDAAAIVADRSFKCCVEKKDIASGSVMFFVLFK